MIILIVLIIIGIAAAVLLSIGLTKRPYKECPGQPKQPICTPCKECPGQPALGSYALTKNWTGAELIPSDSGDWYYFLDNDPTSGLIVYRNGTKPNRDLLSVTGTNQLKISVSSDTVDLGDAGTFRRGVRLHSTDAYDYGFFVISVDHIPEGVGVWPAFWLLGEGTWACSGEIDIIEGINSVDDASSYNSSTLHTSANCPQGDDVNCNASDQTWTTCGCSSDGKCPTKGCLQKFTSNSSFGFGFNKKTPTGGIFACELSRAGVVKIWYYDNVADFPTDNVITISKLPAPTVQFQACASKAFRNMRLIINTTLCGQWAGKEYDKTNGDGSCKGAVLDTTYTMSEAYWMINWLKVYQ